jgi:hypothetical protein
MIGPDTTVAPTVVSGPFACAGIPPRWQRSVVAVIQREDRRFVRLAA